MSRILGIDLGAYSVKVVVANPGFRNASVAAYYEQPVPPGDEPHEERAARVLGEILRREKLDHDTPYAALSGNRVFIHVLEFAFKSLRRPDLQRAVGAELEGILPIDLEDMVYTFEPLPALPERQADGGEGDPAFAQQAAVSPLGPGPVAAPTSGMRVLACAGVAGRIRGFLEILEQNGAEPRGLVAAPASYPRVIERIGPLIGVPEGQKLSAAPPVAIVDIGHERTDICVVAGGRADYVRTINRGGKSFTQAIANVWNMPFEQAEGAKHTDGFLASEVEPAPSANWARIHEALAPEASALVRDLRQTLVACRAKTGVSAERLVLVGGGSRLRGLASFIAERLHLPTTTLGPMEDQAIMGPLAQSGYRADVAVLAAGVAFEGASGRPSFDLRQGDLSFKTDLSFLRAKAVPLAAAVLIVIAFASVNAYAHLFRLRKAEQALDKRVALESTQVLKKKMTADEVLEHVGPVGAGGDSPIPERTAYDLLLAFNEALPPKSDVTIDVEDIDIKPSKVTVRGVAQPSETKKALEVIKVLEANLKSSKCFSDFASESKPGRDDSREFTLTISVECK